MFLKFIDTCLKYYELDPCHYFSAPGLSWDAMLKMTDEKLEKISDIDKYLLKKDQEEELLTFLKDLPKLNLPRIFLISDAFIKKLEFSVY